MILQECLEGKFGARVVAVVADDYGPQASKYVKGWMLSTISEEEEEHHHHRNIINCCFISRASIV